MKNHIVKSVVLILLILLAVKSCLGFQRIAWGTGEWWGEYSLNWALMFLGFIAVNALFAILAAVGLWRAEAIQPALERVVGLRERLGGLRWLFFILVFISPVYFFQFTAWGVVFTDVYIRVSAWLLVVLCAAFFITRGHLFLGWKEVFVALLLTSSEFVIASSFMNVTDYPFSLGWSEGNRMWDYSILFGRRLYDYPLDKDIFVLLDVGRQFVGGLPFLIPGLTIKMERFWLALTIVIPYLLLGFAAFRFSHADYKTWILAGLWVLIFLKQGPIHPPLILCGVAVALLWRSPLWLAVPLIAVTGYIAEESRFTWIFAPGLWIGMLELAGATLHDGKLRPEAWLRAVLLGLSGAAGGQFGQKIAGLLAGDTSIPTAASVDMAISMVSAPSEPLLWYRLLPNETYGVGILLGLVIAILPLSIVLLHLASAKKWILNTWQALALIMPLLAFLVVGLIVSTKIGGGGDLHNMDMFLIGLVFTAVVAWNGGGGEWMTKVNLFPVWVKVVLILLFALPGIQSLRVMRSFDFAEDAAWLKTLTDTLNEKSLEMYPSNLVTAQALETIREEVSRTQTRGGEILFIDQRQLLTFGYITDVPLIPEYEKKLLMTRALGSDMAYFQDFYRDLSARRFSLIISEPLRTPVQDSTDQFGEENNAWVKWVSTPILCYYERIKILREVNVEFLAPRSEPVDCSGVLPQ